MSPAAMLTHHSDDGVQRRMEQRHIQMIGLAGTIGTGLFLGSGMVLHRAGPAGALLAYTMCGTLTYAMSEYTGDDDADPSPSRVPR